MKATEFVEMAKTDPEQALILASLAMVQCLEKEEELRLELLHLQSSMLFLTEICNQCYRNIGFIDM